MNGQKLALYNISIYLTALIVERPYSVRYKYINIIYLY